MKQAQNYGKSIREQKEPLNEPINSKEQRVLQLSMYSALGLALFGIGFGIYIRSLAVIFDGFVAFVSVGLCFLSVITSRYIYKEDDDIFQYGYVRFEPMVNLFKSLVLIVVCFYGFISALSSLFKGGHEIELEYGAMYSILAFCFCLCLFFYTRRFAKGSDLVKVDNIEWKIDCVLYAGTLSAFALVYAIFALGLEIPYKKQFALFIDPLLLAVLSLFLCISPIKICIQNCKDLLMVAPKELDEKIDALMQTLCKQYDFKDYDTHTSKSGRFYMVEINILLDKNFKISSITQIDEIRDFIEKSLQIPSYKIWLSISFTANTKWL